MNVGNTAGSRVYPRLSVQSRDGESWDQIHAATIQASNCGSIHLLLSRFSIVQEEALEIDTRVILAFLIGSPGVCLRDTLHPSQSPLECYHSRYNSQQCKVCSYCFTLSVITNCQFMHLLYEESNLRRQESSFWLAHPSNLFVNRCDIDYTGFYQLGRE